MLPTDMMMSTDIQVISRYVSALDICLTSFGDARTVSARICGSADLVSRDLPGLRLGRLMSPRPARIADQADYVPLYPA